ncbi:MAG: spore coat associated protein CotJA [Firmicutes bacterium]|nr:spore coat associated protein CotJA [Bacillota bacterium]
MKQMSVKDHELARAYVPFQVYTNRFEPIEGLRRGTIFPELVRPYVKKGKNGYRQHREKN